MTTAEQDGFVPMRYCDHVFIAIKDIEKPNPIKTFLDMGQDRSGTTSPIMEPNVTVTVTPIIHGKHITCAFCGHSREVWENGDLLIIRR